MVAFVSGIGLRPANTLKLYPLFQNDSSLCKIQNFIKAIWEKISIRRTLFLVLREIGLKLLEVKFIFLSL